MDEKATQLNDDMHGAWIGRLERERDEARAEAARLREALLMVEWRGTVYGDDNWVNFCYWCHGTYPNHNSHCPRQVALGLVK